MTAKIIRYCRKNEVLGYRSAGSDKVHLEREIGVEEILVEAEKCRSIKSFQ